MPLQIHPIPAFTDNYIWAFSDTEESGLYVVDPGDAQAVLDYLSSQRRTLSGILITHHHWDHTGGIEKLVEQFNIPVYGPYSDSIAAITHPLREGEHINAAGMCFAVMEIPGHTLDHIGYYGQRHGDLPILFCGDTLFAAGCGRLFEGSAQQMHHSLQKLAALPDDTRVCCTHEYTLANLAFAVCAEPDNIDTKNRLTLTQSLRAQHLPSLPSSIAVEKQTNPFLRCHSEQLKKSIHSNTDETPRTEVQTFSALRRWKDNF